MNGRNYLEEIKAELKQGRKQWRAGASLLAAFGYVRRRKTALDAINQELNGLGLQCQPEIDMDMPLDTPRIRFLLAGSNAQPLGAETQDPGEEQVEPHARGTPVVSAFKVAELDAANKQVVCVKPDYQIETAYTLMGLHGYSQLVVGNSDKPSGTAIKGIVSYRSITEALMHGSRNATVKDCVEACPQVSIEDDIRVVIDHLKNNDVVLILGADKRLTGIITPWDLAEEFAKLAEPFKYIEEIETRLGLLVHERLDAEWIEVLGGLAIREGAPVDSLTMGDLVKIVEHPDYWRKLEMPYDRVTFAAWLNDVREFRNRLMHFRDPLGPVETIRIVNLCRMLRAIPLSQ